MIWTEPTALAGPVGVPDRHTAAVWDTVLGGALPRGSIVLLAGRPGAGKSSLAIQLGAAYAAAGETVLVACGEEAPTRVRERALRVCPTLPATLLAVAETRVRRLREWCEQSAAGLLIVDSLQTATVGRGLTGGTAAVTHATAELVALARTGVTVVAIGHVTKQNQVGGPMATAHMVDVVLRMDSSKRGEIVLSSEKNRFGPADEILLFRHTAHGLEPIKDPSALAAEWKGPQVGVCLTVAEQGAHLVLTSLEALVEPGKGKRHALNYPVARLHALISILGRDLEQDFSKADVVLSHPGGWPLTDPTTDTAAALAIMSATYRAPLPEIAGLGELTLAGEVRPVGRLEDRCKVAARYGVPEMASGSEYRHNAPNVVHHIESVRALDQLVNLLIVRLTTVSRRRIGGKP